MEVAIGAAVVFLAVMLAVQVRWCRDLHRPDGTNRTGPDLDDVL